MGGELVVAGTVVVRAAVVVPTARSEETYLNTPIYLCSVAKLKGPALTQRNAENLLGAHSQVTERAQYTTNNSNRTWSSTRNY